MFRDSMQRFGIQSIVGRKGTYGKEDGGRLSDGDLTHDCLFFLGCWYLGRVLISSRSRMLESTVLCVLSSWVWKSW